MVSSHQPEEVEVSFIAQRQAETLPGSEAEPASEPSCVEAVGRPWAGAGCGRGGEERVFVIWQFKGHQTTGLWAF